MVLHLDYETKSSVNLLTHGAYLYARSPSTKVLCFSYAEDDDPVQGWTPGMPIPQVVIDYFEAGEPRSIHAHNAAFERLISWYVFCPDSDLPEPPMEAFYCTAAQAAARSLPRGLEDLGRCLGLSLQKQKRGKELIKLMCIPPFEWTPELEVEMLDYCIDDTAVERNAAKCSAPLTDEEFEDYLVNERINDRGITIDRELAEAAAQYAKEEVAGINAELDRMTNGQIPSARSHIKIKAWMEPFMEVDDRLRKLMTVVKTDRRTGEETRKLSMDKNVRYRIMETDDVDERVLDVVDMIDQASRTSVSKFKSMYMRADEDDRVCGAYMFSGAGQTGRYSSLGLQVHNFTRDCCKEPDAVRSDIIDGYELDDPLNTLASMLRPSLVAAPGRVFVVGDSKSIEAICLPWLSDRAEHVLDIYRANFADPSLPDHYTLAAADIYDIAPGDVTPEQRQIGKVCVLSLGFQGGWRAFMAMARNYKVKVSQAEADEIKKAWRLENQWCVKFWYAVEKAAMDAVRYPGKEYAAGRLRYIQPAAGEPLYCILPSGRVLTYPQPELRAVESQYGHKTVLSCIKAAWKPKADENDWPRVDLYGGILVENATQATANDVLRRILRMLGELDWPVVLHTHDEAGLEVREDEEAEAMEVLDSIMCDVPEWAPGLPLACELWAGPRYKK